MVHLAEGSEKLDVHLTMYRFDKTDPARASNKDSLLYYRDYGYEGEVKLGDKTYKAMLADENASGDFRGKDGDKSGVMLLVDVNGNGKFDNRGERFDIHKPFNVGGQTYEVAGMTALGSEFKIVKSDKKVAAEEPSPDLGAGKKIQSFAAKDMDGKAVKFPEDYRGKVVMLDFWATWCGPCMGEVPGLVKAYQAHHGDGFEIVGVTLDQKDQEKKVRDVTGKQGMAWRQIYDGGYWKAELAVKFDIHSIPAAFLVDGDTGMILAAGSELRGEALDGTITKALAKKKGAQ
jgi:thiol-disulfide isomerase/thioredoxin